MTEQNGRQCAIASFALLITNNHIMYTPIYIMSGWHSNDLLSDVATSVKRARHTESQGGNRTALGEHTKWANVC